ncbi:uncharacterized protein [Polyergus mexicanus]|uniref:uncharacterized protein n=1 Tax=Polyergus mexicanus TaxID=615972 RepID=UPI0038B6A2E0
MYMSNSTIEKLVEILRKKVNGPTEAISRIRDVLVSDVNHIPEGPAKKLMMSRVPLSSSSSSEDEDEVEDDDANDNDDDDDDTQDGKPNASKSNKDSSIPCDSKASFVIDSNVNLSGPVTDL